MMDQDFPAWSAQTLAPLRTPRRDARAAAFLAYLNGLRPGASARGAALHGLRQGLVATLALPRHLA